MSATAYFDGFMVGDGSVSKLDDVKAAGRATREFGLSPDDSYRCGRRRHDAPQPRKLLPRLLKAPGRDEPGNLDQRIAASESKSSAV